MAIYHFSVKIIGRSSGRSAVAAAAYRSGTSLFNEELQQRHDFTHKKGIIFSEILLPENAPPEYADRETLWNAVQAIESNSNAQLAREIEASFPKELSFEQQLELARRFAIENFVSRGMIADISYHDKGDGNPHFHIMLTTRGFKANGQWASKEKKDYALDENGERIPIIDPVTGEQKLGRRNEKLWKRVTVEANDWNNRSNIELWRANWAAACNEYLAPENHIDHRSYERQGIDQAPTVHEGYAARQMEKRGETSDVCEYNRQVQERNRWLAFFKEQLVHIEQLIADVRKRFEEWLRTVQAQQLQERERENKRLTDELHVLRNRESELQRDLQTAQTVLVDIDSDDFVARKVAEANQNRLEEQYNEPVDLTFIDHLMRAIQMVQQRIAEVLRKLSKNGGGSNTIEAEPSEEVSKEQEETLE